MAEKFGFFLKCSFGLISSNPLTCIGLSLYILEFDHFFENVYNDIGRDRLCYDLVHFMVECLFDVFLFRMACAGNDHRLLDFSFIIEFPDTFGRIITIHDRHVTVHEDQAIGVSIVEACVLNDLESILTIGCPVYKFTNLGFGLLQNLTSVELG